MSVNVINSKAPIFEDDNFLFELWFNESLTKNIEKYSYILGPMGLEYYMAKRKAFANVNTSPEVFRDFSNRPSLRNIGDMKSLDATIYTNACSVNNGGIPYTELMEMIKQNMSNAGRRMVLRFANSASTYIESLSDKTIDVTCLSMIHYLPTQANLIFRASDIKNELLIDILTIYEFFLQPVYNEGGLRKMQIYASTGQNISEYYNTLKYIELL